MKRTSKTTNPYQCAPQSSSCLQRPSSDLGNILEEVSGETAVQWDRVNDLKTRIEQIYLPLKTVCLRSIAGEILDNAFRYSRKGTQVSISSRSTYNGTRIDIVNNCSLDDYMDLISKLSDTGSLKKVNGLKHVQQQVAEFGGMLDFFFKAGKLRMIVGIPYN